MIESPKACGGWPTFRESPISAAEIEELDRLAEAHVEKSMALILRLPLLFALVHAAHLSLRHPGLSSEASAKDMLRVFVDGVCETLDEIEPRLGTLLRKCQ